MIPFIQLPQVRAQRIALGTEIRPCILGVVLGLILCLQFALLLWVLLKQW